MYLRNRWHGISAVKKLTPIGVLIAALIPIFAAAQETLTMRPSHKVETNQEALVIVNADTIYTSDLDSALIKFHANIDEKKREQFDYHKLLNKLVNDRLLIQEARNLGMDKEDWLVEEIGKIRRNSAIRQYVADNYKPNLDISDSAVRAFFLANYDKIQIRTISTAITEEAQNLIAAIRKGASMDSVANAISLDTYRFKGGLHPIMPQINVEPVLREQALKLKPGQLSPPFPYKKVFAFLRLEKHEPADTAELPLFSNVIKGLLKEKKNQTSWVDFIKNLEKNYPVRIDSSLLAGIIGDSSHLFTQDFTKGSDAALLKVDETHQVTDKEFRTMLSKTAMAGYNLPFDSMLNNTIARAQDQVVLAAAADRNDYENKPEVVSAYDKSLDSALLEVYLKETIVPRIKFTREEFESYYKQNPDSFREPEQFLLDRIMIDDSAKAQEMKQRLAGGADFEYLGKQLGAEVKLVRADESNEWAGLEQFPLSVKADIAGLKSGGVAGPYLTSEGWAFFRLRGRRPGKLKPMEAVENDIRSVIFQRQFNAAMDKTLASLKANASIKYNNEAIEKYFGKD
ncbi:hypothetical protein TRIP_C20742 [Candidatus Zixiibacteriota bacterium]|nr:hypothetical protein TRIP_C20742 [candidate division Zixibacteria bacterium]